MILEKNKIITLNTKKEYYVANTVIYNNECYGLLININEDDDYFIVRQKNNLKLERVTDVKNINKLLKEYL